MNDLQRLLQLPPTATTTTLTDTEEATNETEVTDCTTPVLSIATERPKVTATLTKIEKTIKEEEVIDLTTHSSLCQPNETLWLDS